MVEFPGFDTFPGRIMHAHDLREAKEFKGQKVCLIGGRYSAEDIAMQLLKYVAEKITISFRSKPTMISNIKENLNQLALLKKCDGNKLTFTDGTTGEYDSIILCTGYKHNYPFLHSDLQLKPKDINPIWMPDVYRGVVFENNQNLFYMGVHDQVFSMPMFAAQAWFVRDMILGILKFPSEEERIKVHKDYQKKANSIDGLRCFINFQGNYIKDLNSMTDFPKYDTDKVCQVIEDWCMNKINDPMTFRDQNHTSVVTGTKSMSVKKTWKDNLVCSFEDFFKLYPVEKSK
jgi:trimethylamine monooxygenase